jgi:uncharacterized protein YbjQ (UPF0145 family)
VGDNDFTAGDPWGLPIDESEEFEIEAAQPERDAPQEEDDLEESLDEEVSEQTVEAEEETAFEVDDDLEPQEDAAPDDATAEQDAEAEDGGWWSSTGGAEPSAVGQETDQEEGDEVDEEHEEEDGDEEVSTAPARTPLSQMIAAAQSVVSSVQGDEPDEPDLTSEVDGSEPRDDEQTTAEEIADLEEPPSSVSTEAEEAPQVSAVTAFDTPLGDDDLPEDPPSWLIVEAGSEADLSEPDEETAVPVDTLGGGHDPTFTPEDIEASIAGLVTPEPVEAHFAEDQFEMPDEKEPQTEDDLGAVDFDSSPGVYSELHHLADQDEQAEALIQEAAAAFGQIGESTESDATEIETDDLPLEPLPTDLEELTEELPIAPEEIDSFAEALATEIETDDLPLEPLSAAAEAGETVAGSDASDYLSEVELSEALAGLTETSPDEAAAGEVSETEEAEEEEPTTAWWDKVAEPEEAPSAEDSPNEISQSVPPDTVEPDLGVVEPAEGDVATELDEEADAAEVDEEADAAEVDEEEEGTPIIDSPVEWGTRYREAHQGWVEDEEGRSTWRPIVTSGESVAGWDIDIYLGLVSGDVAISLDSSETIADDVADARAGAVRAMLDEALARGAHAVVGVTFSIQEIAGRVLVAASGVAVTLRTPA